MPPYLQSISGNVAAGTSIVLTLPNVTSPGNSICVYLLYSGASSSLSSMTDNQGNTYSQIVNFFGGNGTTMTQDGRVAKNIKGGPTTITITSSTSTALAIAFECVGLDNGITFATNSEAGNSTSGSTTAVSIAAGVTKAPHDLQILFVSNISGATYTLGAGQNNLIQASTGTLSSGISFAYTGAIGTTPTAALMTVSSAVAWVGCQNCHFTKSSLANNYQFFSVGDGMSSSERIR